MKRPTLSRAGLALRWARVPVVTILWFAAPGCDNPVCVFSGDCGSDSGGGSAGTEQASLPQPGLWILEARPSLVRQVPSDNRATPQSVVMLEFTESLASDTLRGAFRLNDVTFGTPIEFLDPPPLIGNGRIVILAPARDLATDSVIQVAYSEDERITDLTGQRLERPGSGAIGDFRITTALPDVPVLLATFPDDGAQNQSEVSEVVALFDRRMDPTSFDTSSWATEVDGVPPSPDPDPVPVTLAGSGTSASLTQVWRWRSVDSAGVPVPLAAGGRVEIALSAASAPLRDEQGMVLPAKTIAWFVSETSIPLAVRKAPASEPPDAIGRPNLSSMEDVLEIDLAQPTQQGDRLGVYLFGSALGAADGLPAGPLVALFREALPAEGLTTVGIVPADLALLDAAGAGRLADGDLAVAVFLARGATRTPVQVLDAEPLVPGTQDLLFDVTPPEFLGLDSTTPLPVFRSDMSGATLAGRASEEIRRAEVRTPLGDNFFPDSPATVASATSEGFFVARPVDLGILDRADQPLDFNLRIYDLALNSAADAVRGTFEQVGVVGPDPLSPGDPLEVHVFDATTLEPLPGAVVATHGGSVGPEGPFVLVDSGSTDSSGDLSLASAASGETVLSVDLAGYDGFTFHDVRSVRVDVPLAPSGLALALTAGTLTSTAGIGSNSRWVGDSRVPELADRRLPVATCTPDARTAGEACPFGPEAIRPARLGGQTAFVVDSSVSSLGVFNPASFLRAFAFDAPTPRVEPGDAESVVFDIPALLIDLPPEEGAFATAPLFLSLPPGAAPDGFGLLAEDPIVTVEGLSPGIPGSIPVGLGAPFEDAGGAFWASIAAIPGAVRGAVAGSDPGRLVAAGTIDADLRMRVELVDEADHRSGRRPRFSLPWGTSDDPDPTPDVPVLRLPATSSGGREYVLEWDGVLLDAFTRGGTGLYRVTLSDTLGRRWILWRTDLPDAAGTTGGFLADLGSLGGSGLADGLIRCQVSAFTWEGFDPSVFLWTDLEREHDHFAHAATVTFGQP